MRIAVLWKATLIREALVNLLESRGRFDIVVSTDSVKTCLEFVRNERAHAVIANYADLDEAQRQFLLGAKSLGSFGLVFVQGDPPAEFNATGEAEEVSVLASSNELFSVLATVGGATNIAAFARGEHRIQRPHGFSAREHEVAKLVAKGYSNRKIAEETGVREQSVKNLVSTIMRKLGAENRTQVALRVLV